MSEENKTALTMPQRFTNAVAKAYSDIACGLDLTQGQKQLVANYYIKLDEMFRNSKQQITWKQIKLPELAVTLSHAAKLGLDMSLDHLSFMPFWDSKRNAYTLVAVKSAQGYEYIAKKYALDPPKHLTVNLVYSNDFFEMVKRDADHEYDTYRFQIKKPFDRGEIVGGFSYLEYEDKTKNEIKVFTTAEILSYKPPKADDTFWGKGENRKKMFIKTIAKQATKRLTLDPEKVNGLKSSFDQFEAEEVKYTAAEAKTEIDENMCQGDVVDVEFEPVVEPSTRIDSSTMTDNITAQNSLFNERNKLDEGELL